jgi:hypothetical protein
MTMLTDHEAERLMRLGAGMNAAERRQLSFYLQREGSKIRDPNPCHCYEHCEDDDASAPRRPSCRKRGSESPSGDSSVTKRFNVKE